MGSVWFYRKGVGWLASGEAHSRPGEIAGRSLPNFAAYRKAVFQGSVKDVGNLMTRAARVGLRASRCLG